MKEKDLFKKIIVKKLIMKNHKKSLKEYFLQNKKLNSINNNKMNNIQLLINKSNNKKYNHFKILIK
jgi:myo-inositol-hexaphosphate 3-phosphohydrolase